MVDDDTLMLRVQKGDRHAFRILMERYQGPVYGFFMRSLSHPEDSEDLTQQTFVRLFGAKYRPRPSSSFKAFLFTIAANLLTDHRRKDREGWNLPLEESGQAVSAAHPDPSPAESAEAGELELAYREALEGLPPEWKTVLDLRVSGEMSYREISEVTGLTVPAVESVLFRARQRLAGELGRFREGGTG